MSYGVICFSEFNSPTLLSRLLIKHAGTVPSNSARDLRVTPPRPGPPESDFVRHAIFRGDPLRFVLRRKCKVSVTLESLGFRSLAHMYIYGFAFVHLCSCRYLTFDACMF